MSKNLHQVNALLICKHLEPVIYMQSNQNCSFTLEVGLVIVYKKVDLMK